MQLKTSTKLALKFTFFVIGILLVLGIVVQCGFAWQWYRGETQKLNANIDPTVGIPRYRPPNLSPSQHPPQPDAGKRVVSMPMKQNFLDIPALPNTLKELRENKIWGRLSSLDEEWVLFKLRDDTSVRLVTVSHFVENQLRIARLRGISMIAFALLTFLLARWLTRHSLQKLRDLSRFVQQINIQQLDARFPLSGPEDDEIRTIATAINTSLDTVQTQTTTLKDFMAYASHELKTPLMALTTNLTLVEKTQDFGKFFTKQKSLLSQMKGLIEQLLEITKQESSEQEIKNIDLVPIIEEVIEHCKIMISQRDIIQSHPIMLIKESDVVLWRSIVTNLITNALTYSKDDAVVTVTLDTNSFRVHNAGSYISKEDQHKIFERFWKQGSGGHGLGLYLVKLLVEKHGWSIHVESTIENGTAFIIDFSR